MTATLPVINGPFVPPASSELGEQLGRARVYAPPRMPPRRTEEQRIARCERVAAHRGMALLERFDSSGPLGGWTLYGFDTPALCPVDSCLALCEIEELLGLTLVD